MSKFDRSVSQCQAPVFVSAEEWDYGLTYPWEISPSASRFRNNIYRYGLTVVESDGFSRVVCWSRMVWRCTSIDIDTFTETAHAVSSWDIYKYAVIKIQVASLIQGMLFATFLSKVELSNSYITPLKNPLPTYKHTKMTIGFWNTIHIYYLSENWISVVRISTSRPQSQDGKTETKNQREWRTVIPCWSMKSKFIEASTTANSTTQTHTKTHTMQK